MARPPAGWPVGVPLPGSPDLEERAVGWLLDQAPPCLRTSALRTHPRVLASAVLRLVDGEIEGLRRAYASARVEVRGTADEPATAEILAALEAAGASLLQTRREVRAVCAALGGPHADEHGY